jgi:hypothetical protein
VTRQFSKLTSNGNENKLNVHTRVYLKNNGIEILLKKFFGIFLNNRALLLTEMGSVLYCLIAFAVSTVDASF